uniref:Phospholipase A2-like central domain-containing protein n=1 Tax=Salarias fasciatus TaxID=181472 RepID=A0A672GPS7_SALFA
MRSRCLLQVASVLSSLFLTKAHDVSGTGVSCIRSSPAGGQTRVSFVRQDRSGARSLLLTLWSEDAELLACEVHSDPRVTESYAKICEKNDTRGQEVFWKFNLSVLQAPDGPCSPASRSAPGTGGAEGNRRRKRAWIFPGTLWCGSGSKAGGYDQLGMFESADRCCREHDHCRHIIPAFTVNYGVFNSNVFTVSHCECDQRFRECLLGVNDSISSMVGYSFFNILQHIVLHLLIFTFFSDHKHWCESLKILDECKFKIPPWENKYELQNWESKTAYHCDCTARLALELERLEQPSIVPRLLVDFVSQQCFTLPKEKKCHHRKRF